jgi:hypothetical protein
MNPDTNQFYMSEDPLAPGHIPFHIGEEIEVKGHIFVVEHIDMPTLLKPNQAHLLVLRPVRKKA